MLNPHSLVILGCGGHARSVADVALSIGIKEILFVDEHAKDNETLLGFRVQKELPAALPSGWACCPALGDAQKRQWAVEEVLRRGYSLTNIISKTATIGVESEIGLGSFVGHHAHIGPRAHIGLACIINTAAIVEHDAHVGDYTHISVNTTLCGTASVGDRCFIGAGAVVIDGVKVCGDVTIGAGTVVVDAIAVPGTYVGIPAKRLSI